ncbi:hypothetical protein ACJX0J_037531, partial [Zea mays]
YFFTCALFELKYNGAHLMIYNICLEGIFSFNIFGWSPRGGGGVAGIRPLLEASHTGRDLN